jgi:hypothetical protein
MWLQFTPRGSDVAPEIGGCAADDVAEGRRKGGGRAAADSESDLRDVEEGSRAVFASIGLLLFGDLLHILEILETARGSLVPEEVFP